MSCIECNKKLDDDPLYPTEIGCGYCYWQAKQFPTGTIDWVPLLDMNGNQITLGSCMVALCDCLAPNFLPGGLSAGTIVVIKCLDASNLTDDICCIGKCKYKIMYINPLNPSMGKKWVMFENNCEANNCPGLSVCGCQLPNAIPNLPIGTEVGVGCRYSKFD